ncbi:MAG: nucleotide-binding protein [Acidimicrobiales bacterium]
MSTLRVAVAGKGGAGKTTFSSTLARTLARRGRRVIVIDGDSNPNVAVALGVPRAEAEALAALPIDLVSRRLAGGTALKETADTIIERHGIAAPDGVSVLLMAMPQHADEGCLCSAHAVVSGLLNDLDASSDAVAVLDLEASPEHLSRGTTRNVDVLFLVVEPYYRSYETARRMAGLAAELPITHVGVIANKVRSAQDMAAITEFCARHGLSLDGEIPWSTEVLDADRDGIPVLDYDPSGPVVASVNKIADRVDSLAHSPI